MYGLPKLKDRGFEENKSKLCVCVCVCGGGGECQLLVKSHVSWGFWLENALINQRAWSNILCGCTSGVKHLSMFASIENI